MNVCQFWQASLICNILVKLILKLHYVRIKTYRTIVFFSKRYSVHVYKSTFYLLTYLLTYYTLIGLHDRLTAVPAEKTRVV